MRNIQVFTTYIATSSSECARAEASVVVASVHTRPSILTQISWKKDNNLRNYHYNILLAQKPLIEGRFWCSFTPQLI